MCIFHSIHLYTKGAVLIKNCIKYIRNVCQIIEKKIDICAIEIFWKKIQSNNYLNN